VYHKLRRRGSFDFPVLGVAAWVKWETGKGKGDTGNVAEARIVLGGVASWPQEVPEAGAALVGTDLSDEGVAAARMPPTVPQSRWTIPTSICPGGSK